MKSALLVPAALLCALCLAGCDSNEEQIVEVSLTVFRFCEVEADPDCTDAVTYDAQVTTVGTDGVEAVNTYTQASLASESVRQICINCAQEYHQILDVRFVEVELTMTGNTEDGSGSICVDLDFVNRRVGVDDCVDGVGGTARLSLGAR